MRELEVNDDALLPAELLIAASPLPQKAAVAALHIATATVHNAEYLLKWNCRYIANAVMRNKIEAVLAVVCASLPPQLLSISTLPFAKRSPTPL